MACTIEGMLVPFAETTTIGGKGWGGELRL